MNGTLLMLMLLPPLAAAAMNALSLYLGDRLLSWRAVQSLTLWATGLAFVGAALTLAGVLADPAPVTVTLMRWFEFSGTPVDVAFRIDMLSAVMATVVAGFGFVIARFSINYMHNERGFTRYFATYALFVAMMLVLVLADNLLLMFLGWEGVGLCSYLLIGHYSQRNAAARAATEAFIANRIGDAGLIVGIVILLSTVGTVKFDALAGAIVGAEAWVAPVVALCLLVGAVGKSAQLPLGGWLAKAMEGPTPSSALIHAATMVTAGVYLIVRAHPLFEAAPAVMMLVALIGAATALSGALGGQTGTDIKGILASSTTMHLGIMFVACGLGAYTLAIFYVVAHAFYKSYKFLTAPSILHHLHGRLDLGSETDVVPLSSGLFIALLAAVGLLLAPPVLAYVDMPMPWGAATLMMAGGALVGAAQFNYLLRTASHGASHGANHHGHACGGDHGCHDGHDHAAAEHGEPHAPRRGWIAWTIAFAASAAAALQVQPGLLDGSWLDGVPGLGKTGFPAVEPGLAVVLALVFALLAVHATLSVLFLNRATPERALAGVPALRAVYATASSRFWIDALIQERIVPMVIALSERLGAFDARYSRGVMQTSTLIANAIGDVVGWLDTVPRRMAESLPPLVGTHVAEVAQNVETATTSGFEASVGRFMRALGRSARTAELGFGRPAFSVVLVVVVTLAALSGA